MDQQAVEARLRDFWYPAARSWSHETGQMWYRAIFTAFKDRPLCEETAESTALVMFTIIVTSQLGDCFRFVDWTGRVAPGPRRGAKAHIGDLGSWLARGDADGLFGESDLGGTGMSKNWGKA